MAQDALSRLPARETEADLARAGAERVRAEQRLLQFAAEHVESHLAQAREQVTGLEAARRARELRLAELSAQIATYGDVGPEELLERAQARQEQAQRAYDLVHERATAARVLYETLDRHRRLARAEYAGPFRSRLTWFAQGVFGTGVEVSVDERLTITAKTVNGATVPFASLSAGAREQLGLLGRVACAELVAPGTGGVPLILDDALGHSDRDRLDQVAAILDKVGGQVQIIVLTHAPDRFPIASARRVRL